MTQAIDECYRGKIDELNAALNERDAVIARLAGRVEELESQVVEMHRSMEDDHR